MNWALGWHWYAIKAFDEYQQEVVVGNVPAVKSTQLTFIFSGSTKNNMSVYPAIQQITIARKTSRGFSQKSAIICWQINRGLARLSFNYPLIDGYSWTTSYQSVSKSASILMTRYVKNCKIMRFGKTIPIQAQLPLIVNWMIEGDLSKPKF